MLNPNGSGPKRKMLDGIDMTPLVWGPKTILVRFELQQGSTLPSHHHPYEQTGFLVSGRLRLTIGAETVDVAAGASWCIPSDVAHSGLALADCAAVEVFTPLREDYLP